MFDCKFVTQCIVTSGQLWLASVHWLQMKIAGAGRQNANNARYTQNKDTWQQQHATPVSPYSSYHAVYSQSNCSAVS